MVASGDKLKALDISTIEGNTSLGPIVRLVQQATQNLTSNTQTAITFGAGSEDIDTDGYHDTVTNNTRITPAKAGYYICTGILWLAAATTTTSMWAAISKNGTNVLLNRHRPDAAVSIAPSVQVTTVVSVNGTTDYIELVCLQVDSGGTTRATVTGTGSNCTLEAVFLRPL